MIFTTSLRVVQVVYALFILLPAAAYWYPLTIDQQVYLLSTVIALLVFPFVPDKVLRKPILKSCFVSLTLLAVVAHVVQIYNDLSLLNGADKFPAVVRSIGIVLIFAGGFRLRVR